MSAVEAYLPFLNLNNNQIKLLSRSGLFSNLLFINVPLCLVAASNTTLILPGLLGHVTACPAGMDASQMYL